MIRSVIEFTVTLAFFGWIIAGFCSCEDKYLTVERRVVDADNKIPVYFNTYAEQDGVNTWRPVWNYYVFSLETEEGFQEAYFHCYIIKDDSIIYSGVQSIDIQTRKKVSGEFISVGANFAPELIANSTPMAYVSVRYE